MTPDENIENALFARAALLNVGTPRMPIFWSNINVSPPVDGGYLVVTHFKNRGQRIFLKGSDPTWRQGILQVAVVTEQNKGPALATTLAGAVAAFFPADLALFSENVTVKITKQPDVMSGVETPNSWDVPVSVYYEAFC